MPVESRDIIILLLGIIGSALLAVIFQIYDIEFGTFNSADVIVIITTIIALGFIITIFYKRFSEITTKLEAQELEHKKNLIYTKDYLE